MKTTSTMTGLLIAFTGISAAADIAAIDPNTPAEKAANEASQIFEVQNFKVGQYAFKLVRMDSRLNGDLSTTSIVLVGDGAVGGAAGYDAAFLLTPAEKRKTVKSLKVEKDGFVITFYDFNGPSTQTVRFTYDPKTRVLIEQLF